MYALTTNSVIKEKLAIKQDTIIILKKFDDLRNDLVVESSFDEEEVILFISGNTAPLVQEFSQVRNK